MMQPFAHGTKKRDDYLWMVHHFHKKESTVEIDLSSISPKVEFFLAFSIPFCREIGASSSFSFSSYFD